MYLILTQNPGEFNKRNIENGVHEPFFTDNINQVAKAVKAGAKAYKLDSLTEIKEIEVTYQEIIKEADNV